MIIIKRISILSMLFVFFSIISDISIVSAVTIQGIDVKDVLNTDLSMTEKIIINISNNTNKEFSLTFPENAYNITADGIPANHTISDETACEECVVEIIYSYPEIIQNDSENYTFYRKIEMPTNVTTLKYSIELPINHTINNISDTRDSVMPTPQRIVVNETLIFEWDYNNPEFPKEFAIRYREIIPVVNDLENGSTSLSFFDIRPIAWIIIFILAAFIVGLFIGGKKKNQKK